MIHHYVKIHEQTHNERSPNMWSSDTSVNEISCVSKNNDRKG